LNTKTNIDRRIILFKNLVKCGLNSNLARIISVDAGGSQIFVNEEYLIDLNIIDMRDRQKYLECIAKFYLSKNI